MRLVLHRYIFVELLKVFVLATAAITLFLSLANALGTLRDRGLGPIDSVHLVLYFIPAMLVFAMPIGALLTTTLIYGRLASDNEITACRASGISTAMLLKPVFVLGLLIGAVTFLLHDRVIPWARYRAEEVGKRSVEGAFFQRIRTRGHDDFGNENFFISAKLLEGNMLYGAVITQHDSSGKGFVTYAPAARVEFFPPDKTPSKPPPAPPDDAAAPKIPSPEEVAADCWDADVVDYGSVFIKLFNLYMFTEGRANIVRGSQGVLQPLRRVRVMDPAVMTLTQLLRRYRDPDDSYPIRNSLARGAREDARYKLARKLKAEALAEMHGRYAMIVACVLLVILGAALGLVFRHGHILTAFFISMGPALFAIFCILVGTKMVRGDPAGMHSKTFIVWIGNVVVLVIDAVFIGRMVRQ